MKLSALLALPLALTVAACGAPPELTATDREDAFDKCLAEVGEELEATDKARQLAKDKPQLFDSSRNDYYDNFGLKGFLITDEYTKVTIIRGYCSPSKTKHKGYWSNLGYIEYLNQPLDGLGNSEVEEVIVSYGFTWYDEDSKKYW